KLHAKGVDLLVANNVTASGAGFGSDTNRVILLDRTGQTEELPLLSKRDVADRILDRMLMLQTVPRPSGKSSRARPSRKE
ncbi:MAG: phosphopantothenoylcysteine decarboxylase domain-containing protein, partial [Nitrospira sp.]